MPFFPESSTLNTVNELVNLSHTITYSETVGIGGGVSYPVTITTTMPNSTINISGNTISGYYSDSFDNDIYYRTVNDQFVMVDKWQDINDVITSGSLSELYHYIADTRSRIVYSYTATANGNTKVYTINVDNDWTPGRDELLKYTNPSKYIDISITWINNNNGSITWINGASETLTWVNNV